MALLPILTHPNPELRKIAEPVSDADISTEKTRQLVANLVETMKAQKNGVGIAATQVGIHRRIIIVTLDGAPSEFINPVITERSYKMVNSEEGCFSVPGTWGVVKRHRGITIVAQKLDGSTVTLKTTGFAAIEFQHEIDHLNGVLFIDLIDERTTSAAML